MKRVEPLCSPRARCYTLRFVCVPTAPCEYCSRAERLVDLWETLRRNAPTMHAHRLAKLGPLLALLLLVGCGGEHGDRRDRDAGELDAGSSWLCYCGGTHAITCTAGEPICDTTDPATRVAKSEHTTCSCTRAGKCVRDADCIDVR